jgi:glutamine amidotransferase
MIGILEIGMGNIRSIINAVFSLGYDFLIVSQEEQMQDLSHLIIPGVGSFRLAMENIAKLNLYKSLKNFVDTGRPVLGICLGMQILSDYGEEGGGSKGLGFIEGSVMRLPDGGLPIPHVGWNDVQFTASHPVFHKVKNHVDFYFSHSYRFIGKRLENVFGVTHYGIPFSSIVAKKNVIGFQFHPEKSQVNGLRLLENFCEWNGTC